MRKNTKIQKIYSLTPMQEGMLFHAMNDKSSSVYFEQILLHLDGQLDVDILQKSFNILLQRYDILRTAIVYEKIEKPKQVVLAERASEIVFKDISDLNEEERKDYIEEFKKDDIKRGFDLTRDTLIRISVIKKAPKSYGLVLSFHHIIMDGWCLAIVFKELFEIYVSLKENQELAEKEIHPYNDYIQWFFKQNKEEAIAYWDKYLEGIEKESIVPNFASTVSEEKYVLREHVFEIEEEATEKLKLMAKDNKVTVNTVFQSLWGSMLQKYNNTNDIIFGSVVSGRPPEINGIEEMVGLFVNTIPVRINCDKEMSFQELIKKIHEEAALSTGYHYVPLSEIQSNTDLKNNLINHLVGFENYPLQDDINSFFGSEDLLGFKVNDIDIFEQINYDFNIIVVPGDKLKIRLSYNEAVYTKEAVKNIENHMKQVLHEVIENPKIQIKDIEIITKEEKQKVLFDFNNTESLYPQDKTVHELFMEQAKKNPNKIAVVFKGVEFTYRELDEKSNRLANYIREQENTGSDFLVGILMDSSEKMFIAILGILKAGGAYVPIDPEYPEERIKYIIDDAKIKLMLSTTEHIRVLNRLQWECENFSTYVCLDERNVYEVEEKEKNELMNTRLWQQVADDAVDDIEAGGWKNSYTGEDLSKEEMDEYSSNIFEKLRPYLNKDVRVLEIGCASGLSMFKIAPLVNMYYGTDLSDSIIEKNRNKVKEEKISNIKLACLQAGEIDKLDDNNFDIVIINSVIQCFHGHNYLRKVITKVVNKLGEKGILFIGDVMDQDLKAELIESLIEFKNCHSEENYRTKTDFSNELFVSRNFFEDIAMDIKEIKSVKFTDKMHTIENELTKFRYDALFEIDKKEEKKLIVPKHKYQLGNSILEEYSNQHTKSEVKVNDLAYVIYTSGTTGNPKGVMIEHRSLVNLCFWHNEHFEVNVNDRSTKYAGVGFDASVWEIFPYLIAGTTIYIIENDMKLDIKKLEKFYNDNAITISFLPTQICEQFMEECNFKSLRKVLAGGDKLKNYFKKEYDLINNYGPTENTVVTTSFVVNKEYANIPIGKPISNSKIYILDKNQNIQPIGIPGELCISGKGLARGYVNNVSLTKEKFISNPFEDGERMYKSGDLARWLPDGNIEFLGRIDSQVKIRGFRIELGEIESQILKYEKVKEVVTVVKETGKDDKSIYAYIVSDEKLQIQYLKEFLSKTLPSYMIPAYFIQLEAMPLNANGKIDKKALLKIAYKVNEDISFEESRNELEEKIASIWKDILGISNIGINEDFFELGGDSLKAIRFVLKCEQIGLNLKINDIFKYSSIKKLSEYLGIVDNKNNLIETAEEASEAITCKFGVKSKLIKYNVEEKEYYVLFIDDSVSVKVEELIGFIKEKINKNICPHYIKPISTMKLAQKTSMQMHSMQFSENVALKTGLLTDVSKELMEKVKEEECNFNNSILKQNVVRKYGIAPCQKFHLEYLEKSGTIIKIERYLDINLLHKAILHLISKQGLLRSILVKEEEEYLWQEYNVPEKLSIPYVDLSEYDPEFNKEFLKINIGQYFTKGYEKEKSLLYKMLLVKENLKDYLLVLPFSHAIFDAMSSEILSRKIFEYYDALENGKDITDAEVESYESYIEQVKQGSKSITEEEVINVFGLEEFERYLSKIEDTSSKCGIAKVTAFNYDISLEEIQKSNFGGESSEIPLELVNSVCQKHFSIPKVPIYMIGYGRKYEEKTYFNTIGEFIDLIPILGCNDGNDKRKLMEQAQDKLNISSKHGINFFNLIFGKEISESDKKMQYLMKKHSLEHSIVFNFQGKFEKEEDQFINDLILGENTNYEMLGFVPRMQFNARCYKDMVRITVFLAFASEEEKIRELLNTELENILKSTM
ncbi:condensation domain-containing protein [Clostridium saccharobutylicum]|uniref:Gramicidin S synthase 2 n=2 Tax=Clostridium saccharobutylicum TaxID=169679 RepID=U5MVU2_CLOSA|nr:condensation domain-containing protein [Clostridium saccharobutylicum]AGX44725.1 gramicidin S synthase 2 [Clostridium saccharobutylicum DSM 13864]AQR92014.1 gramicidin S synthase 2 [Clostridium saccharobutylicum]AQS01916.1 gramicidin S synthase 2 [Clostridium saccharobutylicum]AQS11516.1 gramicidin S synthase 2 [Clostridium saccharobutylicum]AQS15899.1 gramicidin S synthase 2 [Clostridium saccharobutylicum]